MRTRPSKFSGITMARKSESRKGLWVAKLNQIFYLIGKKLSSTQYLQSITHITQKIKITNLTFCVRNLIFEKLKFEIWFLKSYKYLGSYVLSEPCEKFSNFDEFVHSARYPFLWRNTTASSSVRGKLKMFIIQQSNQLNWQKIEKKIFSQSSDNT
jgi:hypothetical protein